MGTCLRRLSFVLASLLLAAPALAAQISLDAFSPVEGSVGTPLSVELQGVGAKPKPKLWLTRSDDRAPKPRKTRLQVLTSVDAGGGVTALSARFKRTRTGAGLYDLHVKAKGAAEVVFAEAFTMRDPVVLEVRPGETTSKAQVTVTGAFFGELGKPVVRLTPSLGGKTKKAKVQQTAGGNTLFVKLPKLAAGIHALSVTTKVGVGVLEDALVIDGGGGGPGSPNLDGPVTADFAADEDALLVEDFSTALGNPLAAVSFAQYFPDAPFAQLTVFAQITVVGGTMGVGLTITGFVPGVTETPVTILHSGPPTDYLILTVTEVRVPGGTSVWNSVFGGPASVTITSADADHVEGTFEGLLGPITTSAADGDLVVTNGTFSLDITTIVDED